MNAQSSNKNGNPMYSMQLTVTVFKTTYAHGYIKVKFSMCLVIAIFSYIHDLYCFVFSNCYHSWPLSSAN